MPFVAGVDLGTTFCAAAVADHNRIEVIDLGIRSAAMPSVVSVREDGEVLTGESANRRAALEPLQSAREFKRRLGDPTPLLLNGVPYGAEALTGFLLRDILARVSERMGEPPELVVVAHPANYGNYKLGLLEEAARQADTAAVSFVPEPVAAAVHYSQGERIEPGALIAVYDLGGGTFDAAVVRRTEDGFELLGTPGGLERFGGIDMDEAVLGHVRSVLGDALPALDPSDSAHVSALVRLRDACRDAKEALSEDIDATVSVMLPGLHTEVRITRSEFEDMIRPRIRDTLHVLERAVASTGVSFSDLASVLLVGGSSRIPLISEMVRQATARPVALDAHPKLTVTLGAARIGLDRLRSESATTAAVAASVVPPPEPPQPPDKAPEAPAVGIASARRDQRQRFARRAAPVIAALVFAAGAVALAATRPWATGAAAPATTSEVTTTEITESGDAATSNVVSETSVATDPSTAVTQPGITFVSDRAGEFAIYVMNDDGSDVVQLTSASNGDDGAPSWSPDGRQVAYSSGRDGNLDIYVSSADGSDPVALTSGQGSNLAPAWSPGGALIAFMSNREGNLDIYVMQSDGSNQTRLTTETADDLAPDWSPDGDRIAFVSERDGPSEVYVMDADGSNQVRLSNNESSEDEPAWSPDGSLIAFTSDRDGNFEVYVMDADGSNPMRLTTDPAVDGEPVWSPDGSRIAFTSDRDGNFEVYVMDADGSNPMRLTDDPGDDRAPTWAFPGQAPDGEDATETTDAPAPTTGTTHAPAPTTGTTDAPAPTTGTTDAPTTTMASTSAPDLIGLSKAEANQVLLALQQSTQIGFNWVFVTEAVTDPAANGIVLDQSPAPGKEIFGYSTITVVVGDTTP